MLLAASAVVRAQAQGCRLLGGCHLARLLSSAPVSLYGDKGDVVFPPADSASSLPAFVQLPERTWGALSYLSFEHLGKIPGFPTSKAQKPGRIAVVREAFTSFDASAKPLSELIAPIKASVFAVAAAATEPQHRLLIDEYEHVGGGYVLRRVSEDLLRFLHSHHVQVCLVPDVAAAAAKLPNSAVGATKEIKQSTNEVLMVAPTAFGFNEQAAQDNSFMHSAPQAGQGSQATQLTRQVLREYSALHHQLTEVAGVKVHLFQHSLAHGTPDACFPNNWFSTHAARETNGARTLVLYPLKHPNRSAERRPEVIEVLRGRGYERVVDMSVEESSSRTYFEGTGVLVIDRINGVAYVNISERADRLLAERWVDALGYKELVAFRSQDLRGKAVYHTNVMMGIGTDVAIVCAESVGDPKERQHLMSRLRRTHEVVDISLAQMDALCGNVLELEDGRGLPVMAMSTQAYNAFTPEQRTVMRRHVADLVHAPIDTLERVGGGGVRCTLAELF